MSAVHEWGIDGALVLVATPIGHLGELSPRAISAFAAASVIYAEDTRRTRQLLAHAGVTGVELRSLHKDNEARRSDEVMARVLAGELVVLVSDAGMPGVSDPGSAAVRAVGAAGGRVGVVSGPSSVVSALALSGFGGERFVFEGFLPRSGRERSARVADVMAQRSPVVLFESARRLGPTLRELAAIDGARAAVVVRELSKVHEDVWRASLTELAARANEPTRGEIVVVLGPSTHSDDPAPSVEQIASEVNAAVAAGARRSGAAAEVAARYGITRKVAYDASLAASGRDEATAPAGGEIAGANPSGR